MTAVWMNVRAAATACFGSLIGWPKVARPTLPPPATTATCACVLVLHVQRADAGEEDDDRCERKRPAHSGPVPQPFEGLHGADHTASPFVLRCAHHSSASAPATTSRICWVISAWRARFICERVRVDQLAGVLGRVAHRRHARAVLRRGRLEQRAVDRDLEVRRAAGATGSRSRPAPQIASPRSAPAPRRRAGSRAPAAARRPRASARAPRRSGCRPAPPGRRGARCRARRRARRSPARRSTSGRSVMPGVGGLDLLAAEAQRRGPRGGRR